MTQITVEEIAMMAEDLFGGEASCSHKIDKNGVELVVVQSFDKIDGSYEEIHFARFDSLIDAYKYYERHLNARNDKNRVGKGGNFKISMDTDGTYFLDGYENSPAADVLDKPELDYDMNMPVVKEDSRVDVVGYRPRHDFTNENGKVYIEFKVSIPFDLIPIYKSDEVISDFKSGKLEDFCSKSFMGESFNYIFKKIQGKFFASNSAIKTEPGTKMTIFEVFFGSKKINRL